MAEAAALFYGLAVSVAVAVAQGYIVGLAFFVCLCLAFYAAWIR
jgi:hypothetical protein